MTEPIILLTRQNARSSLVLPFHLVWFGRLSKRQGAIALRKRLIVLQNVSGLATPVRTAQLTRRGRREVEVLLNMESADAPRVFAYLLEKFGHVTEERAYVYNKAPMADTWKASREE
ncbi:hypothetical protein [Sulfitobacter sp. 1A12157]|uniref:hypothetical protein n=1 Tax=Sulfitobacter sp. 1A12157 TaxID=3368594 RepID=UPI0037455A45